MKTTPKDAATCATCGGIDNPRCGVCRSAANAEGHPLPAPRRPFLGSSSVPQRNGMDWRRQ